MQKVVKLPSFGSRIIAPADTAVTSLAPPTLIPSLIAIFAGRIIQSPFYESAGDTGKEQFVSFLQ
jgi:hypothetical protein